MKIIKSKSYEKLYKKSWKQAQRYKSDEEISSEFDGMQIVEIQVGPSRSSGWIELSFPEAGEHVGGGADELTDRWIKYDNGKIAFENWYPTEIYSQLVNAIERELENYNF